MVTSAQQKGVKVYTDLSIIRITLSCSHQKAAFRDSTAGGLSLSYPSVRQICLALSFWHICAGVSSCTTIKAQLLCLFCTSAFLSGFLSLTLNRLWVYSWKDVLVEEVLKYISSKVNMSVWASPWADVSRAPNLPNCCRDGKSEMQVFGSFVSLLLFLLQPSHR